MATIGTKKTLGWYLSQQAKAWIGFHAELASGVLYRIMIRLNGRSFCRLYNLKAWLSGADVRAQFDAGSGRSFVRSPAYRVETYPQRRATIYSKGVEARAKKLGADYLLPLVHFADGDVVIDCGANVGDLKLYFRDLGVAVEYVGIEPGPGEFAVLQRNVQPSKVHNVGLWNEDGELTFYVSSGGADSSLIEPPAYDSVTRVPTRRLDTLVDYPRIKLLKIEAEGAEPEALEGATGLLDRIEYITADVGGERGIEQESTLAPVTNFLLGRGFEFVALNPARLSALYRNTRFANDR